MRNVLEDADLLCGKVSLQRGKIKESSLYIERIIRGDFKMAAYRFLFPKQEIMYKYELGKYAKHIDSQKQLYVILHDGKETKRDKNKEKAKQKVSRSRVRHEGVW
jgi:hypothetical protein